MPIIKKETTLAEKENREPELMSHISSHILWHTGCTKLGESICRRFSICGQLIVNDICRAKG